MTDRRIPQYPVDPLFIRRWSPRAFDVETMPETDLLSMLEAARWAPSAYNLQPWRFLYALRDDAHWEVYLGLLDSFNAQWAANASALIFVLSDTTSAYHSFDTGASWAMLALQATALGYHTHAMAGLDFDRSRQALEIPETYKVEIAIAVGRQADASTLPAGLQLRETPSDRLPVARIARAGGFCDE